MGIMDLFRRKSVETRSSGGYTGLIMAARQAHIVGASGLGELTAAVQSCVTLWESGLALADVKGTDLLTRRAMALTARSLALRGEAVFLIADRLIPASDWDVTTRNRRIGGRWSGSVLGQARTAAAAIFAGWLDDAALAFAAGRVKAICEARGVTF